MLLTRMLSKVDLPEPRAPMIDTSSLDSMVKSRSRKTWSELSPNRELLLTFSRRITARASRTAEPVGALRDSRPKAAQREESRKRPV